MSLHGQKYKKKIAIESQASLQEKQVEYTGPVGFAKVVNGYKSYMLTPAADALVGRWLESESSDTDSGAEYVSMKKMNKMMIKRRKARYLLMLGAPSEPVLKK
jgi:hypothetical protein